MCNFYTRHCEPRNLQATFRFTELPNDPPRWVVRPTDTERVVAIGQDAAGKDGLRHAIPMRWGIVPPLSLDMKIGYTTFNWRSEDFERKRTFGVPFRRGHRCLVPCDGFFEFTGEKGNKQPWLFNPRDGRVMAFAGLWDAWIRPTNPLPEPLLSFGIATTSPNATVSPIHDRMPVLFTREEEWNAWLDPDGDPERLKLMLRPAPDDLLEAVPVSKELLRTKEPGPENLARVEL